VNREVKPWGQIHPGCEVPWSRKGSRGSTAKAVDAL
jgi:hypothetical protein